MPDDARMTTKMKMLRALIAGVATVSAAVAAMGGGGQPGIAAECQRSIAIDPQATVSEVNRTLTFVVHTNSCAQAGYVSFVVTDRTAERPADFMLENGRLEWAAGDTSRRLITATITGDQLTEEPLENFTVMLVEPSETVRVASAAGEARIFDDDDEKQLPAAAVDDRICLVSDEASCLPREQGAPVPFCASKGTCTFEPGHIIIAPIVVDIPNGSDETVFFATSDGGLVAGLDYVPVSQAVVIPAGTTVAHVQIELLPHAFTQSGKSFNIHVSNYSVGGIVDGDGLVTIVT